MGNGLQYGIQLSQSKNVKYYVGLEPNKKLYKLAKQHCNKYKCKIKIINDFFDNYESEIKFNVILFVNSFHFMQSFENTLKKAQQYLEKGGIIIIKEPRAKPHGWAFDLFNKKSLSFDQISWNKKKTILKKTKHFLLQLGDLREYQKLGQGHLFIIQ